MAGLPKIFHVLAGDGGATEHPMWKWITADVAVLTFACERPTAPVTQESYPAKLGPGLSSLASTANTQFPLLDPQISCCTVGLLVRNMQTCNLLPSLRVSLKTTVGRSQDASPP